MRAAEPGRSLVDARVHAEVLSPASVSALRRAVEARLDGAPEDSSCWYSFSEEATNLFEAAARCLLELVPDRLSLEGAEIWMRRQPADTGFPFHFDRDESLRPEIVCPEWSSILYLSEAGGPTLVLDLRPGEVERPEVGVGVHPSRGDFFLFPGHFLHGVQPGPPEPRPRVALYFNFWARRPGELEAFGAEDPQPESVNACDEPTEAYAPERFSVAEILSEESWARLLRKVYPWRAQA